MTDFRHPSHERMYRRRRVTVFSLLAVVLLLIGYVSLATLRPIPANAADLEPAAEISQPATPLVWPDYGVGAIGAVGIDGILGSLGTQESTPMASITKTVTALVVLDRMPLAAGEDGPELTLTQADARIYAQTIAEGGSASPVVPGSVFTERQLLQAMMLPSANNYSITLANWAFGSMPAFLSAASDWLAAHDLAGTRLADSSGLSSKSTSTAADLVAIGELALAHPVLSEIVREESAELPVIGTVQNTNKLLGSHGVIGLKTGTTDAAGACLLFAAEATVGSESLTFVGVILGAPNHRQLNQAVASLIDSATAGFTEVQLVEAGDMYGSYTAPWGASSDIVASESASVLVWQDAPVTVAATASDLEFGEDGSEVGSVTFEHDGETIVVPLVLEEELDGADLGWKLANAFG
ncbi:D-alanyl-D-alanine carboxypeptidase [Mycetocola sp. 2940]|uniref:D-alanyl-D-alanine carboxypeptidase family protein n=1 Tax=Mycetocola sp. 2940 TaxID=3156452 RepID=UPI00339A57F7